MDIMFLLSLNIGCSMMDILYLKILLFSNDGHYVEEHQSGLLYFKQGRQSLYTTLILNLYKRIDATFFIFINKICIIKSLSIIVTPFLSYIV